MSRPTIESDWENFLEKYSIEYPFDADLKAIKIREDDVNDELLKECVEDYIISKVSMGYFITDEDIEQHLEVINEHGMEAYLKKRLELLENEQI